jgi:replicative DNA helicase
MNAHTFSRDERQLHFGAELPDAIQPEQALLGALLVNNDAFGSIPATFSADFFAYEEHRKIFCAMSELRDAGKRLNPVTIKMRLNDVEVFRGVTISQYLANLAAEAVSIVNAEDFVDAIVDNSARRDMVSMASALRSAAYERELQLIDQIEAAEARLAELHARLAGGDRVWTDGATAFANAIQHAALAMTGSDNAGVECGFGPVSQLIGKLMPGQLIIIGGGTKQGKSALARQIAIGAARNGAAVLDYSGEMDHEELARRELARISKVPATHQLTGGLSDNDLRRLRQAKSELDRLPWNIIDRRRTLEQLCREFETFAKRHPQAVLVVDSVTLFELDRDTRKLSKYEFAEYATDRLKALARKTGTTVIALSQLKKNTFAVEKQFNRSVTVKTFRNVVARRPRASDLYGACERDADHVLIPYNPMPILQEIEPAEGSDEHVFWEEVVDEYQGRAEIILALSRHQPPDRRQVRWHGETTSFLPKHDVRQETLL